MKPPVIEDAACVSARTARLIVASQNRRFALVNAIEMLKTGSMPDEEAIAIALRMYARLAKANLACERRIVATEN